MKIRVKKDDPDTLYNNYLDNHIQGVKDVFENTMLPRLIEDGIGNDTINEIRALIDEHDLSKYSDDEWSAYRNHFYDPEGHPRSHDVDFNKAWNHHQKCNPHHWQYWVLINDVDDPQLEPMEIPFKYVIEMLCDWQSAGAFYGNTAYDWYDAHKDRMIFHPNSRELVEKYIGLFKNE